MPTLIKKNKQSNQLSTYLLVILVIFFSVVLFFNLYPFFGEQHFSYLAESFLHGKLYFLKNPGHWKDAVFFQGHYYWPPNPFPAVLLTPFVYLFSIFGQLPEQGYIQYFLVLGVFCLCYKIANKLKYSYNDSALLAFAFCFSSVFIGVALWPWSWQFSQVTTTFLLFLAIYEFLHKKRYWLIGFIFGLMAATRMVPFMGIAFFILEVLFVSKKRFQVKVKNVLELISFPALSLVALLLYNQTRFGNFFQFGYADQIIPEIQAETRSYGMLSLVHLPRNLYYFFLSPPELVFRENSRITTFPFVRVDKWGMSMLITSPIFLYLFLLKNKDVVSKILLFTVLLISLPVLFIYNPGGRQFGYRYALEFLPLLFFLLARNYKRKFESLSRTFKVIIYISALTNLYLFFTYAGVF